MPKEPSQSLQKIWHRFLSPLDQKLKKSRKSKGKWALQEELGSKMCLEILSGQLSKLPNSPRWLVITQQGCDFLPCTSSWLWSKTIFISLVKKSQCSFVWETSLTESFISHEISPSCSLKPIGQDWDVYCTWCLQLVLISSPSWISNHSLLKCRL